MLSAKKAAAITKECVACGCCVTVCPVTAISVHKGILAVIDSTICIGCGKCKTACPAGVIEVKEAEICEETVV